MLFGMIRRLAGIALISCLSVSAAAQTPQPLGEFRDWSAYRLDGEAGRTCYIASKPLDSEPKNVRRGDIWVLVTHRPAKQVSSEVSVYSGYPYAEDSDVEVAVGDQRFTLYTHGETAWVARRDTESKLVDSMRKGAKMVVRGTSSRGTDTVDTFSLIGFTAALEAIDEACEAR